MSVFALRAPGRGAMRAWGFVFALASVVLPPLPMGPLFAQPPMPLAVLWAAYGWAAEDKGDWKAPTMLALFGLLHDALSGGPLGPLVVLYLAAYLIGRVAAVAMSAPNILSLWGGFLVTALCTVLIAMLIAPWAYGPHVSVRQYAEAAGITVLLFPIVRPLYMDGGASSSGARR